jgi:glutamate formiminotransferase
MVNSTGVPNSDGSPDKSLDPIPPGSVVYSVERVRRIIECPVNLSEGRDEERLASILAVLDSHPGTFLLDVHSDPDHNRSVITLAGEPEGLEEGVFALVKKAVGLLDIRKHRGMHPRIGVVDVVPFVPLGEATMDDCVSLAHRFGEGLSRRLDLPVYLYGRAARRPERRLLAAVRRGEYEDLKAAVERDEARAPDFGPSRLHPTAGAVAVGARDVLIAFNVHLATRDIAIARSIARIIRESNGGLPAVQALGLYLPSREHVQVSVNLTDFRTTSPEVVVQRIREEALRFGTKMAFSEVVGLIPRAALPEDPERILGLRNSGTGRILESRVEEATGCPIQV